MVFYPAEIKLKAKDRQAVNKVLKKKWASMLY